MHISKFESAISHFLYKLNKLLISYLAYLSIKKVLEISSGARLSLLPDIERRRQVHQVRIEPIYWKEKKQGYIFPIKYVGLVERLRIISLVGSFRPLLQNYKR